MTRLTDRKHFEKTIKSISSENQENVKKYKINEIFYSIQGEGCNAGKAAIFVRFSGCNLQCPFCDTQHQEGTMMSAEEIRNSISQYPAQLVVLTGGEPTLFADRELCDAIHASGKLIAMETNGSRVFDTSLIDHITCSPKYEFCPGKEAQLRIGRIDELKVVYTLDSDMNLYEGIHASSYYLQPCDTGNTAKNEEIIRSLFSYVLQHPKWGISLQLHKILNVR